MMNYVYILRCQNGSYYTGWTNDLARRFAAHCSGRGAKYTRANPPVCIAYAEAYENRRDAMAREVQIKQMNHIQKHQLVKSAPVDNRNRIDHNKIRRYLSMKELKFYRCEHCKNVIVKVHDSTVPVVCCGEPMKELTANTVEASKEKHIPVVTRENNTITVTVGAVDHPMLPEHYIEFIALETENGFRIAYLNPGDKPSADFYDDEKVIAVYAYCNQHGLWKTVA